MSRQPGDMRSRQPDKQNGAPGSTGPDRSWRWALMVLLGVVVLAVLVSSVMSEQSNPSVSYSQFLTDLEHGEVTKAQVNSNTGAMSTRARCGKFLVFVPAGDQAFRRNHFSVAQSS